MQNKEVKVTMRNNSDNIVDRIMDLGMIIPLTKVYPYMKCHSNSMGRIGVIVWTRKSDEGE